MLREFRVTREECMNCLLSLYYGEGGEPLSIWLLRKRMTSAEVASLGPA